MKKFFKENWLKLIIALGILIIVSSVFYYFVIFFPNLQKNELLLKENQQNFEQTQKINETNQATENQNSLNIQQENNSGALNTCLSDAEAKHSESWKSNCQNRAKEVTALIDKCKKEYYPWYAEGITLQKYCQNQKDKYVEYNKTAANPFSEDFILSTYNSCLMEDLNVTVKQTFFICTNNQETADYSDNCSLPMVISNSLEMTLRADKDECFKKFK